MTPETLASLKRAFSAHTALKRAEKECRHAEAVRRAAVAEAWRHGATAKEISVTLEISLAKTYTLLPERQS
jgi:hypothetical protein